MNIYFNEAMPKLKPLVFEDLDLQDKAPHKFYMDTGHLTIHLDHITANWLALHACSAPEVETAAVLKAEGYGLGADEIGKHLIKNCGVKSFFVATVAEGASLRDALGPKPSIFVFCGTVAGQSDAIARQNLIPLINSQAQFERHRTELPHQAFGIQLDTGMSRLGMSSMEWSEVKEAALTARPALIISHLACADTPDHSLNKDQLRNFHAMTDNLGIRRSLAATGGILLGKDYHFDLVRPGIGLHGSAPFIQGMPSASLELPVIQTRQIQPGTAVGYGASWRASRPVRVATVSAGYADGLIRKIGAEGALWSNKTRCPFLGRISMDLVSVDISALDQDPETLTLIGPQQSVDDLAEMAGTIGYEILTGLGRRFKRVYKEIH